jgi:hypothetical protein
MKTLLFIFAVIFTGKSAGRKTRKSHRQPAEGRMDISLDRARFNGFMSAP